MSEFTSFSRLNNIPLYVYPSFCLSITPRWTLGLLPPLVVVANATVISSVMLMLSEAQYISEVELLDRGIVLVLVF